MFLVYRMGVTLGLPLQVVMGMKEADACEMRGAHPGPWWARST